MNNVSSFLILVSDLNYKFDYSLFITDTRDAAFRLARHIAGAGGVSTLVYSQSGALVARFSLIYGTLRNSAFFVFGSQRHLSHVRFLYYLDCARSSTAAGVLL